MSDPELFEPAPQNESQKAPPAKAAPQGSPRLLRPDRYQMRFLPTDLNALLEEDHPARAIWAVVETLDLSKFEAAILARGENAGRPAIDPKILLTLGLYATREGVGSAREVERLCEAHHAYQWICGGVHVNHHTLSDFRVSHQEALDDLMTQILGVLDHQGLSGWPRTGYECAPVPERPRFGGRRACESAWTKRENRFEKPRGRCRRDPRPRRGAKPRKSAPLGSGLSAWSGRFWSYRKPERPRRTNRTKRKLACRRRIPRRG